ncbi:lytic transglycosylase domain-containing protein [Streptomyces sp. UNOB3_S3]|uniref:lytic transglycosylase domain-containing protein n=1 Tax=Streptomyces sp. UNOB3_S3 TaxID=2871682 RepID=UPI001E62FD63|nr:lytic transglycosylase domain-containing protein [Streptomyces sp. UNOB3_S3]MCC3776794.1 lytic transglycosylase domain-containing protein [Streptomyces sp. UNOB3_S3]
MKILRTRAASVSRQGLCTALLVASLTTAAVGASPASGAFGGDPSPGPDNPQRKPHGVPNLTLPDLVPRPGASGKPGSPAGRGDTPDGSTGIPVTALAAYKNAEKLAAERYPGCHIPWQLVAGIGKVESEHAASYGLRSDGTTERQILGPRLTGGQFAEIKDTDGGRWDGDAQYDRAVGPTQFIPSTWESYGVDGNGDGKADPNNIFDAAAGTARYLCAGNKDLRDPADLDRAILSYNNSREYVNAVLAWMRTYQSGQVGTTPDTGTGTGTSTGPTPPWSGPKPTPVPPVNGGGSGTGTTKPGTPSKPSKPSTPDKPTPDKPKPDNPSKPDKPGGGGDKPTPDKPKPPAVSRLDRVGDEQLTATAGETFAEQPAVRALTADGKAAPAGTRVTFEVVGLRTGARFEGDNRTATVTVDKDGKAVAPKLTAGDVPGDFTVRATVDGKGGAKITTDFAGTVKAVPAPRATSLERDGKGDLTAAPKSSFKEQIKLKALDKDKGKAAAGAMVTVTVLERDGKTPATTGPYFLDGGDTPQRRVTLVKTDENGYVTLPKLFTDEHAGTYILHLTTTDGAILDLELTVAAPATQSPAPATPSATPTKK